MHCPIWKRLEFSYPVVLGVAQTMAHDIHRFAHRSHDINFYTDASSSISLYQNILGCLFLFTCTVYYLLSLFKNEKIVDWTNVYTGEARTQVGVLHTWRIWFVSLLVYVYKKKLRLTLVLEYRQNPSSFTHFLACTYILNI